MTVKKAPRFRPAPLRILCALAFAAIVAPATAQESSVPTYDTILWRLGRLQ